MRLFDEKKYQWTFYVKNEIYVNIVFGQKTAIIETRLRKF